MNSQKPSILGIHTAKRGHLGATSPVGVPFRAATVLCLLLLTALSALGQAGRGNSPLASIHGTLTTAQDNAPTALAGITLKLSPDGAGGIPETADTDESG